MTYSFLRPAALLLCLLAVSACDSGNGADVDGPFTLTAWTDGNEGWSFEDQQLLSDESPNGGLADFHVDTNQIHAWGTGARILDGATLDTSPIPNGTYTQAAFRVEVGDVVAVQTRDGRYAKLAVTQVLDDGLVFNQVFPVTQTGGTQSAVPQAPGSASTTDHVSH